jgi:hypothetical protein
MTTFPVNKLDPRVVNAIRVPVNVPHTCCGAFHAAAGAMRRELRERRSSVGALAGADGAAEGPDIRYQNFLDAITDPTHEDYERLVMWAGGHFLDQFDVKAANETLKRMRWPVRHRR